MYVKIRIQKGEGVSGERGVRRKGGRNESEIQKKVATGLE